MRYSEGMIELMETGDGCNDKDNRIVAANDDDDDDEKRDDNDGGDDDDEQSQQQSSPRRLDQLREDYLQAMSHLRATRDAYNKERTRRDKEEHERQATREGHGGGGSGSARDKNDHDDEWGAISAFFMILFALPILVFPIAYWVRALCSADMSMVSATQDAFYWIISCWMGTVAILLVGAPIMVSWKSRNEIRQAIHTPTFLLEENNDCEERICAQTCFFLLSGIILVAMTLGMGYSVMTLFPSNGVEKEEEAPPSNNDHHNTTKDEVVVAEKFLEISSSALGMVILAEVFVLLVPMVLLYPIYECLFQCYRRRQGYVATQQRRIDDEELRDLRTAIGFWTAVGAPIVIFGVICGVRVITGRDDMTSAILKVIGWAIVSYSTMVALILPVLCIWGSWAYRGYLTTSNLWAMLSRPVKPSDDWLGSAFFGTFVMVFLVGFGIYGFSGLSSPSGGSADNDGTDPDSGDVGTFIFIFSLQALFIEGVLWGLGVFLVFTVYPIYASIFGCVYDSCSGRNTTTRPPAEHKMGGLATATKTECAHDEVTDAASVLSRSMTD